jgi:hypothetical protein
MNIRSTRPRARTTIGTPKWLSVKIAFSIEPPNDLLQKLCGLARLENPEH